MKTKFQANQTKKKNFFVNIPHQINSQQSSWCYFKRYRLNLQCLVIFRSNWPIGKFSSGSVLNFIFTIIPVILDHFMDGSSKQSVLTFIYDVHHRPFFYAVTVFLNVDCRFGFGKRYGLFYVKRYHQFCH